MIFRLPIYKAIRDEAVCGVWDGEKKENLIDKKDLKKYKG